MHNFLNITIKIQVAIYIDSFSVYIELECPWEYF